ncbi:hydantoinase/oxoprolinase family protein [Agrobacterium tumefaciens]|uniref:hydantoinase/oxoprolinase family protein n=1 Tax=Agrobacterium tumefaciens TaxID=358 RepID=UPI0030141D72|nr:hydantoinase/oxoprolinase family protein [Agrobacterium tumefaciens]
MSWIIGVDVGGTFTDFFAYNEQSSESRMWKRPSTPTNPAQAIIDGLIELGKEHSIALEDVTRLCHGSTVATNALIQRRGAQVAMVTTAGFRDVLEIGRQTRPMMTNMQLDQPEPLVPRERRLQVVERVLADGSVHKPVDPKTLEVVIEAIKASESQAVAVCLLFSYLRPDHEQQIAAAIKDAIPGMAVSISSAVQPEFREFERFTTTVINAYLQPRLEHYISSLLEQVRTLLPNALVGINQSSGGLMSLDTARSFPVRMALSGPAAGMVGAVQIAKDAKRPNIITVDIGGTSADVALIRDHAFELAHERDVDGFPIRLPMIDISTVGAGGGSIAWFDVDGLFKVGPQSAGAVPGPACYQRGGDLPTVSDANLVLGRLSDVLLNGSMTLDRNLARKAIATVADPMGKTVEETALGMLEIMTANMVRAIRTISVERGHDPREFTLMPFGGAGALHARDVAVALGMKEILVPSAPGIVCAKGLTDADLQENFVSSCIFPWDGSAVSRLSTEIAALSKRAEFWFLSENAPMERQSVIYSADVRFQGQNFELSIEIGRKAGSDPVSLDEFDTILDRFFEAHERSYGFANRRAKVEIVTCRANARASLGIVRAAPTVASGSSKIETDTYRDVFYLSGTAIPTPVLHRDKINPGDEILGPAIIDQMDSTIVIFPNDVAKMDEYRNILITIGSENA